MTIKLSPSNMYGHWTHCEPKVCEFQHGTTMIYISYNSVKPMESRLVLAQQNIEAAFDEVGSALEFAREISQRQNPEFWQNVSRIQLKQRPLIVFAVRYPIDADLPIYEISWNPSFDPETGVAMSEGWIEEEVQIAHLPENNEVIYLKRLDTQRYIQIA